MKDFLIEHGCSKIGFSNDLGPFPSEISFSENGDIFSFTGKEAAKLEITLPGGKTLKPFIPENYEPSFYTEGDAECVCFNRVPFSDSVGEQVPGIFISVTYEIYPDGTAFADMFFTVEQSEIRQIDNFKLSAPVKMPRNNELRWSCWNPPEQGKPLVMALKVKRNLPAGENLTADKMILPQIGFESLRRNTRTRHFEYFMEGANSLSPDPENTCTEIKWNDSNTAEITWDFLKAPHTNDGHIWQWRNRWGWVASSSPLNRKQPPLRVFHYLDNSKKYPSPAQIKSMREYGAELLIIHENWRLDVQNGALPYDEEKLKSTIKTAHENKLRIALYIRGEEQSAREDACSWFDRYLQKDFDGLYIDYGSAICLQSTDERYPGGRIHFREFYKMMKRLRNRVGNQGVLIMHSGPFFSACGMSGIVDGYLSGEGEKGVMVNDRTLNAYYGALSVSPPALWLAAFPEYRSEKALSYLASTGQFPHVPLGVQIQSSSLAHPDEPACAEYIRPLWKLWELFEGENNIKFLHEFNSEGFFKTDSEFTGASLMATEDGYALMVISNFSENKRECAVSLDYGKYLPGFLSKEIKVTKLDPINQKTEDYVSGENFKAEIPASGISAFLIGEDSAKYQKMLEQFRKKYPAMNNGAKSYKEEIEQLKDARFTPFSGETIFMKTGIPFMTPPIPYEDSLMDDLHDNIHSLNLVKGNGEKSLLGYICRNSSLSEKAPTNEAILRMGDFSSWIALHEILPPGEHDLEIKTTHAGEDFYSFVTAELSNGTPGDNTRILRFANELDNDRSRLTFKIKIS